ncbi:hypothetical protein EDL96_03130 [Kocuria soli]|uniref:Alpha/beta hydrolase n=1 Tax=Kocuria soli TaxID=2485125 RepID=A0A3N3ZZ59_9MICC|nr:alpha/beta hydrolase [Kocuria soli]ROZ64270.1 hypothetical protein EDL96_03130 [Kocuria soli]
MTSTNHIPAGTDRISFPDKVVIVHGFGATAHDHWFGWLADRIPHANVVSLPDPERPDAATWIPRVVDAIGQLEPGTAVVARSLDLSAVRPALGRSAVLRSDNDALVPADLSDDFAHQLGIQARVVPGAGHFLDDDGVTELPAVLEVLHP